MTAAPVAVPAAGRYGRSEGSWIFEMMCSPSGLSRTVSGVIFPSVPGAPFGQSFIGVCCADANQEQSNISGKQGSNRFSGAQTVLLIHERSKLTRPSGRLHPPKVENAPVLLKSVSQALPGIYASLPSTERPVHVLSSYAPGFSGGCSQGRSRFRMEARPLRTSRIRYACTTGAEIEFRLRNGGSSKAIRRAHKPPEFNDGNWRTLHLPHDWSIEGPFSEDAPAAGKGAYLPTGIGWYRKHFTLPADHARETCRAAV